MKKKKGRKTRTFRCNYNLGILHKVRLPSLLLVSALGYQMLCTMTVTLLYCGLTSLTGALDPFREPS